MIMEQQKLSSAGGGTGYGEGRQAKKKRTDRMKDRDADGDRKTGKKSVAGIVHIEEENFASNQDGNQRKCKIVKRRERSRKIENCPLIHKLKRTPKRRGEMCSYARKGPRKLKKNGGGKGFWRGIARLTNIFVQEKKKRADGKERGGGASAEGKTNDETLTTIKVPRRKEKKDFGAAQKFQRTWDAGQAGSRKEISQNEISLTESADRKDPRN